jgi:uncharacterized protein (DUF1330 family)
MRSLVISLAALLLTAVVSSAVTWYMTKPTGSEQPVYLVGAVTITDAERLPEYQAIAGPLAAKAGGYVPLAFSEPTMIEGARPGPGLFFVERYDSIEGLKRFVESQEFQEAKKLRDEVADVHFMLVVDAYQH